MRDRNGPKTGEVTAIFGLPSFRPEWALWGITYPTFQIASITSNKGTCEPVPRNSVTANKISLGQQAGLALIRRATSSCRELDKAGPGSSLLCRCAGLAMAPRASPQARGTGRHMKPFCKRGHRKLSSFFLLPQKKTPSFSTQNRKTLS
jgi:hypothetical protein